LRLGENVKQSNGEALVAFLQREWVFEQVVYNYFQKSKRYDCLEKKSGKPFRYDQRNGKYWPKFYNGELFISAVTLDVQSRNLTC